MGKTVIYIGPGMGTFIKAIKGSLPDFVAVSESLPDGDIVHRQSQPVEFALCELEVKQQEEVFQLHQSVARGRQLGKSLTSSIFAKHLSEGRYGNVLTRNKSDRKRNRKGRW